MFKEGSQRGCMRQRNTYQGTRTLDPTFRGDRGERQISIAISWLDHFLGNRQSSQANVSKL